MYAIGNMINCLAKLFEQFIIMLPLIHVCILVMAKSTDAQTPFQMPEDYNKQLRPNEGGMTDEINVGIYINSVRSVNEMDMTITLDIFQQGEWFDKRLIKLWKQMYRSIYNYDLEDCNESYCNLTKFTMGAVFSQSIWKPDFYISNAVSIRMADDINDNVCVRVYSDGKLWYSNRVILTVSCMMKLAQFPFDKHTCTTCMGSYKYNDYLLMMTWSESLAGMNPDQNTANFFVSEDTPVMNNTQLYLGEPYTLQCTTIAISRKYNIFLVTLYLPSISLVLLSWVNFWIDPKAIPARSGLSITAILAQITLIVGMAGRFPSVSDLKMSDLYLTINFFYTFAALIEFAIVAYIPQNAKTKESAFVQSSKSPLVCPQSGLPTQPPSPIVQSSSLISSPEKRIDKAQTIPCDERSLPYHLNQTQPHQRRSNLPDGPFAPHYTSHYANNNMPEYCYLGQSTINPHASPRTHLSYDKSYKIPARYQNTISAYKNSYEKSLQRNCDTTRFHHESTIGSHMISSPSDPEYHQSSYCYRMGPINPHLPRQPPPSRPSTPHLQQQQSSHTNMNVYDPPLLTAAVNRGLASSAGAPRSTSSGSTTSLKSPGKQHKLPTPVRPRKQKLGWLARAETGSKADHFSKVLFPTTFLIWNIVFFLVSYISNM